MISINPSHAQSSESEVIILPESQDWLSSSQALEQFGLAIHRLSRAARRGEIETKLDPSNKSAKLYLSKDVAKYCQRMSIEKPSSNQAQAIDMSSYYQEQIQILQKQVESKDELVARLSNDFATLSKAMAKLQENGQTLQRELQDKILPKLEEKPTQDLSQELIKLQESQQILQKDIQNTILPKINQLEEKPTPKPSFWSNIFGRND